MTNLLHETIDRLSHVALTPADVCWVGSRDGRYSLQWSDFAKIADFEYDSGYGGQEIASDLVVVTNYGWLERGEYDGSEWWEWKSTPRRAEESKPLTNVGASGHHLWESVEGMMDDEDDSDDW